MNRVHRTMPLELLEYSKAVRNIEPGESYFVTEWSIVLDADMMPWISKDLNVSDRRGGGTSNVEIKRHHDGFLRAYVDKSNVSKHWGSIKKVNEEFEPIIEVVIVRSNKEDE